jgi:putative membrane protein
MRRPTLDKESRTLPLEMVTMMFWYGGHWAFWQAGLMWALMIVFWGLLIWAIYALITRMTHNNPGLDRSGGPTARQILDQRLAHGDIDEAEYSRLRELISAGDDQSQVGTGRAR